MGRNGDVAGILFHIRNTVSGTCIEADSVQESLWKLQKMNLHRREFNSIFQTEMLDVLLMFLPPPFVGISKPKITQVVILPLPFPFFLWKLQSLAPKPFLILVLNQLLKPLLAACTVQRPLLPAVLMQLKPTEWFLPVPPTPRLHVLQQFPV